jgi:hypothetical protein
MGKGEKENCMKRSSDIAIAQIPKGMLSEDLAPARIGHAIL